MPTAKCDLCSFTVTARTWKQVQEEMDGHYKNQHARPPSLEEREEGWEEVTREFLTFEEPGEEVVGVLEGIETISLHDREVRRAVIRTEEGARSFLLTTTLEPLILGIPAGETIRIRYEGEGRSSKGRRIKNFRVWVKR